MFEINNSKETIKNRMLRHALNYWNIKNAEELDPMVRLIMEALSLELFTLGNEVRDTQVRILEKIAHLLAPDLLTSAVPAHALMHVSPAEAKTFITERVNFFTQRKISSKQNEILDTTLDIIFTPVNTVEVFEARINSVLSGNTLFTYDQNFNKQLVAHTLTGKATDNNTVWLGLEMNSQIDSLQNLSFCFDWKNTASQNSNSVYQFLPFAKWYINEKEIKTSPGTQNNSRANNLSKTSVFLEHDLISLLENDINQHYDHKFVTLTEESVKEFNEEKQLYPPIFTKNFTDKDLKLFSEKLLWIKIVFPAGMQHGSLEEMDVYLNAFPIMNRQLNDFKFRLKGGSNIIPLKTGPLEQFVSVKSLSDDTNQYKAVPYRKKEEEESGTYTLRSGGVERFDGRNAKELVTYLLELLRSESAAFSSYGYDFIATTLKEMHQRIALMEEKTKGMSNLNTEIPNYIIVKPFEGNDVMYTEFWTTLGESANNLRPGTRLQQMSGSSIKPDSIFLLSTTIGGKNKLRAEEKINAFRYGIMTRNRIISKEDIRNFCFYELGSRIREVSIERGIEMSTHSHEAFKRTINVTLTPKAETLDEVEWQILSDQLKNKLTVRSGMSNDYRILVNVK